MYIHTHTYTYIHIVFVILQLLKTIFTLPSSPLFTCLTDGMTRGTRYSFVGKHDAELRRSKFMNLCLFKAYTARKLMEEFPSKNWNKRLLERTLNRIWETDTADHGVHAPVRTFILLMISGERGCSQLSTLLLVPKSHKRGDRVG